MKSKIRNMLFVTNESNNKETSQVTTQPLIQQALIKESTPQIQDNNDRGVPNETVLKTLANVLDERNLPGPDYYELALTAKGLANILPDENTRYKVAFTTIQTNDNRLTKNVIIDSLDTYIQIMEHERKVGLNELEEEKQRKVVQIRNSVNDKITNISNLRQQILVLQQTIDQELADVEKVQSEANQRELEINKQERDFNASVDLMVQQLKSDKEKLNSIL